MALEADRPHSHLPLTMGALRLSGLSLVFLATTLVAEPIQWLKSDWDREGPPKGRLLTDNPGWWGRAVWTGVTYAYETEPTVPADRIHDEPGTFGRRLLDGDRPTGWYRPVGVTDGKPLVVTFDFKRCCVFEEVDIVSSRTTNATGRVSFSEDGTTWRSETSHVQKGCVGRIRPAAPVRGRYMRVEFRSASQVTTYLDEVLAWGSAEVSDESPEVLTEILPGEALQMSARRDRGLSVYAVPDPGDQEALEPRLPTAKDRPVDLLSFVMTRRETETAYLAVVNEGSKANEVALTVSGLGADVKAELLIAGLVRSDPPARRLTEKELFDMLLTEQKSTAEVPGGRLSFLPFFRQSEMPEANFLRKRTANARQLVGFPRAVPLAPGEGALLMLRIKTRGAKAGRRKGAFTAGSVKLPIVLDVADLDLSEKRPWVYAWSPFTSQYPFESSSRVIADARAMLDLGVTHYMTWPEKGTRGHYILKNLPSSTFGALLTDRPVFHQVYNGRNELTDEDRSVIAEDLDRHVDRLRRIGLPLERFFLELPDEPGERNALGVGRMAKWAKECHPELNLFSDPSFWTSRGCFADAETVVRHLEWFYNECVDVSVPYRSNVEDPVKRERLFCTKRKVNAQYAHPARRAGRSIAWSSFRYGLDGFAYWAYYTPRGDPWDIRTWNLYDYGQAQMVFPLENGVAVTAMYETMREAVEDYRLLAAVREAGRSDVVDRVLADFADSFDASKMESARPYRCDFANLRARLLAPFVR